MFIRDLFEFEKVPDAYYDERADNTARKLKDTRSTRLTLAQIKQLRKMNDLKKFEKVNDTRRLQRQYRAPAPEQAAAL